jgi:hypothetical protein
MTSGQFGYFEKWRDLWVYLAFAIALIALNGIMSAVWAVLGFAAFGVVLAAMGVNTVIRAPNGKTRQIGWAAVVAAVFVFPAILFAVNWWLSGH